MYYYENIKNKLNEELEKDKALLKAWEGISYQTKKDGTPFAIMSKNIAGATYNNYGYPCYGDGPSISVCATTESDGYVHDFISLCDDVSHMKPDDKRLAKKENYCDGVGDVYYYDLEDIKEAVEERIKYLKSAAESYKKQIEVSESAFDHFEESCKKAINTLEAEAGGKNSLYHFMIEEFKNSYY